jgi:tripartite-type tricarboxylate transporter receptor subunit TctC
MMSSSFFRMVAGVLCMAASAASIAQAHSTSSGQAFPARPLKIIVPISPGGPPDIAGRIIAQRLSEELGQQVVVENRPGAGGTLGAEVAAKSPPDGYTILLGSTGSLAAGPSLYSSAGYDSRKSFAPISMIGIAPFVIVVNSSVPAMSLKEFIELARSKPGEINNGTSGNGLPPHIVSEIFKTMTGLNIVHIPYKSVPASVTALITGDVQLVIEQFAPLQQHIRAGKIRPLAVATAKRYSQLPNVPTAAEAGLPGYEWSAWTGLLAPRGTPPEIIARLNAETVKALAAREVRDILAIQGIEPAGNSPEQFAAFIDVEVEKWSRAVKVSGAKID